MKISELASFVEDVIFPECEATVNRLIDESHNSSKAGRNRLAHQGKTLKYFFSFEKVDASEIETNENWYGKLHGIMLVLECRPDGRVGVVQYITNIKEHERMAPYNSKVCEEVLMISMRDEFVNSQALDLSFWAMLLLDKSEDDEFYTSEKVSKVEID